MPRHTPGETSPDQYSELLIQLLADGYSADVRTFTKEIQINPEAVHLFESIFGDLTDEALIDWHGTDELSAITDQVKVCRNEMLTILEGHPRAYQSYVLVTNHGHEVSFEVGWLDQMVGQVVWDRWSQDVADPVMVFAQIGYLFEVKEYQCAPKPTPRAEPPLYRYHPERFKAYRKYADDVGKFYRHKVDARTGLLTVDQMNALMGFVQPELHERSMRFPRKLKEGYPAVSLRADAEESLATAFGRFVQAGRQIMDFPPALTEMLAKTNVDDMPLESIQLPYASQYLYFGPQPLLQLAPGWSLDGAYVEQRGNAGDLRFTVTAVPTNHELSEQWYLVPEPQYTQDFVGHYRSMDLGTAVDMVLSDRLADLRARQAKAGGDITTTLQTQLAERGAPAVPAGVSVVDVSSHMSALRETEATERHPIYKEALRLAVNALCYMTAYPDDIEAVWPEGTPDSLSQKALAGKPKERQRARSKLAALGYVPVHLCGQRIVEQREAAKLRTGEKHVSAHWRRGHWRNQVHGPGRSLRKLIWVMPSLIGAGKDGAPDTGHLYLVS